MDQQLATAIRCFGRDVVEILYPDDVARLTAVQAARPVSGPAPTLPPATSAAAPAPAAPAAGPEELDLSNAQVGAVGDDGDEDEHETTPAVSGKPATPEELAGGYDALLKSL
jgi:hypothetical protein